MRSPIVPHAAEIRQRLLRTKAHVVLRLPRKHPWIAADFLVAGIGRGGKLGVREIARLLRGKMQRRQVNEKEILRLEAPKN